MARAGRERMTGSPCSQGSEWNAANLEELQRNRWGFQPSQDCPPSVFPKERPGQKLPEPSPSC